MDPNEQEADEKLMKAEEKDDEAEALRAQGDVVKGFEKEKEAQDMKEGGEQQKMDSEAQISEARSKQRSNIQAR